jgi:hypothetical protein
MNEQGFLNKRFLGLVCSTGFASLLVIFGKPELSNAQSQLQIERSRYLQVEQLVGNVFIRSQNANRPATSPVFARHVNTPSLHNVECTSEHIPAVPETVQ